MNPDILDTQIYEVEFWSRQGVLIADVSVLIKGMSFTLGRNESEELQLTLDLNAFEDLAYKLGTLPMVMLNPYRTNIRVKRRGQYLFGAYVGEVNTNLDENEQTIEVRAMGYLDLLASRYITKEYIQQYETDIIWDMIQTTQAQTNGGMGITLGQQSVQLVKRDRTYERNNIKDATQNLTKLITGSFDFEFTHDKKFNTYAMIGSDRTREVEFIYPGNILNVRIPRSGLKLFNKVYGIGAGFGDDQINSTQIDNTSQLNYGVHEEVRTWNSVLLKETLDENVAGRLQNVSDMLEIPQMTVSGRDFDLNTYGIGDRVTVRVEGHQFLNTINGVYRIERIGVSVDENQEEMITVYFDDNDLDGVVEDE